MPMLPTMPVMTTDTLDRQANTVTGLRSCAWFE
jgi:hypothetical protein